MSIWVLCLDSMQSVWIGVYRAKLNRIWRKQNIRDSFPVLPSFTQFFIIIQFVEIAPVWTHINRLANLLVESFQIIVFYDSKCRYAHLFTDNIHQHKTCNWIECLYLCIPMGPLPITMIESNTKAKFTKKSEKNCTTTHAIQTNQVIISSSISN